MTPSRTNGKCECYDVKTCPPDPISCYKRDDTPRWREVVFWMLVAIVFGTVLMALTGCGGLARDRVVVHPDAPFIIVGGSGTVQRVVEDPETGEFIDGGKVRVRDLEGRTVVKYDWGRPVPTEPPPGP